MGRERIVEMFARTRKDGRPAFLPYMTAGLPTPNESPLVFEAMAKAGADGFEVGIPYSDPLMDGPVIQKGSDVALAAGANLEVSLDLASKVGSDNDLPVLAMTYANPVFRRGVDEFFAELATRNIDGVIVPDIPVEEAGSMIRAAEREGLGMVLFVAPTSSPHRVETVAALNPVFIYAVAEMGVTGERAHSGGHIRPLVEMIRNISDVPVVFGVGISGPDQAKAVADAGADGFIMGTALVRRVLENEKSSDGAKACAELVAEVKRSIASR